MQAYSLRPIGAVFLCLLGATIPCLSQEAGSIFTDTPQPLQPRESRSETDRLRLRAATLVMEGRILARRGESANALRRYQRAYRLDPDARVVLKQIVSLALELGRVGEASRYALLLADSKIDDPDLAERLAKLLAGQHEYDGSLQLYQRTLTLRQEQPKARSLVAMQFEMALVSPSTRPWRGSTCWGQPRPSTTRSTRASPAPWPLTRRAAITRSTGRS